MPTKFVLEAYKKYVETRGIPYNLDKHKLGQVIKKLYNSPDVQKRVVMGTSYYCYIDIKLYSEDGRCALPTVQFIPPHVTCLEVENEVHGYEILTMYSKDGDTQAYGFHISEETGIYHVYFGKDRIQYIEEFGFYYKSKHDVCFFREIQTISEVIKLYFGLKVDSVDVKDNSIVPKLHHWNILQLDGSVVQFDSYHSHKCSILLPLTCDETTQNCRTCRHDLRLLFQHLLKINNKCNISFMYYVKYYNNFGLMYNGKLLFEC